MYLFATGEVIHQYKRIKSKFTTILNVSASLSEVVDNHSREPVLQTDVYRKLRFASVIFKLEVF